MVEKVPEANEPVKYWFDRFIDRGYHPVHISVQCYGGIQMTRKSRYLISLLLSGVVLTFAGCGGPPESVLFKKKGLYPEGVEYDAPHRRFLVTSLGEGVIGAVGDRGDYRIIARDRRFVSAIGIRIDPPRNRFLVCNSDPGASIHTDPATQKKLAGLGIFDLQNGKLKSYLNLGELKPGAHFCNDIAVDDKGNAFITDSFSTVIYRVDPAGKPSVFLDNERFAGTGFSLNGIVYHRDGYLIVAKYDEGLLFKVPVNNPQEFEQIRMKQKYPGADGLLWTPDGNLMLIANASTNKIVKLRGSENWSEASVISEKETGQVFPTTGTLRQGKPYVLYSMLHVLFNPKSKEAVETFEIHRVDM